jgi:predicted DCC family thiol-disulfide oxidoreductase YuxK
MARSRAVLHVLSRLGGPWAAFAGIAQLVPRPLSDLAYRFVARARYRLFRRLDTCPIPRPEWRERFIDGR